MSLSGTQFLLKSGRYEAAIASVGATLRQLTYKDRDLVVPFAEDQVRPSYRGVSLAPWPNRIVDGRYEWQGQEYQLPLTEPERSHALHGLVSWADFTATNVTAESVTLTATIPAQLGYPWWVRVDVEYWLDGLGLHQTITGTNLSDTPAPWGAGPHPYLVGGEGTVDDWYLRLPASQVMMMEGERLMPGNVIEVDDAPDHFDFRTRRSVEGISLDHPFTGLDFVNALCIATVTDSSGRGVSISWDHTCPWAQVYTGDLPVPGPAHRCGLAIEPMTCPPNAFNSGTDLRVLEPGVPFSAGWTIGATD